ISIVGTPEPEPNAVNAVTVVGADVPSGFAALSNTAGVTNLNVTESFHSSWRIKKPVSTAPDGPLIPNGANGISTETMKSYGEPAVVPGNRLVPDGELNPYGSDGRTADEPFTRT